MTGSQAELLEEQQHGSNYDDFVKAAERVAELRRQRWASTMLHSPAVTDCIVVCLEGIAS